MEIVPIAHYHCDITGKFGLPRQAGVAPSLEGKIVFEQPWQCADAIRGLEEFDYCHLIWGFSMNAQGTSPTVRPPRLGGNERVGVFASRSPFRPNGLGLSSVRIEKVDFERCEIIVSGADLADGTPIYDVKPYVEYADSHPGVRSGFVDSREWHTLSVQFEPEALNALSSLSNSQMDGLREVLSQDPRPQYQHDPLRNYGLLYAGFDVHFRVDDANGMLTVYGAMPGPRR